MGPVPLGGFFRKESWAHLVGQGFQMDQALAVALEMAVATVVLYLVGLRVYGVVVKVGLFTSVP